MRAGYQRRLAVWHDDGDSGCCDADVAVLQAAVGVLVDAEEAEEGQCAGTPVAGALERGVIDELVDSDEVSDGDGFLGPNRLIAVEVVDALHHAAEPLCARQVAVAECVRSMRDSGDEAGHRGALVASGEGANSRAQVELAEW